MSYLLDRKNKRKKFFVTAVFVVFFLICFYFRSNIFNGLSYTVSFIFRPVIVLGNNIGEKLSSTGDYFKNKKMLVIKNEELQAQLDEMFARVSNYGIVLDENNKLKEMMGRKIEKINSVLAAILSKPNQSPYDTLVIDTGINQGVKVGDTVFALGNVPVGRITEADTNSSKVILFSNPGEKIEVVIKGKDTFMQIVGRGGGNFEMTLPRDFTLDIGTEVHLPGITPYILGYVSTIVSDPRDAFQKALLVSPVNIQELKFVEVQI